MENILGEDVREENVRGGIYSRGKMSYIHLVVPHSNVNDNFRKAISETNITLVAAMKAKIKNFVTRKTEVTKNKRSPAADAITNIT